MYFEVQVAGKPEPCTRASTAGQNGSRNDAPVGPTDKVAPAWLAPSGRSTLRAPQIVNGIPPSRPAMPKPIAIPPFRSPSSRSAIRYPIAPPSTVTPPSDVSTIPIAIPALLRRVWESVHRCASLSNAQWSPVSHSVDCWQSASDPATQVPCWATQRPASTHISEASQSTDRATTQRPSSSLQRPCHRQAVSHSGATNLVVSRRPESGSAAARCGLSACG